MDHNDLKNDNESFPAGTPQDAPEETKLPETPEGTASDGFSAPGEPEKETGAEPAETPEPDMKERKEEEKKSKAKEKKEKKKKDGSDSFFKDRKNVVRLILFIVALSVAVTAIAVGVYQVTNKEPGYYEIELTSDSAVPTYSAGLHLEYYLTGSSNEIKAANMQLTEDFTAAAKRSFQRLDSLRTYVGVDSVATVNASAGEAVRIDAELLDVLADAYERTKSADGYNMFAGVLYGFWDTLLYNYDPVSSDPLVSADQAELLTAIEGYVNDLSGFTFEIDREKGTVLFDYADGLKTLIADYGFEWPVLDLNLLRDAYRLDMLKAELERKGWTNGRLYTEDGLSVVLSGNAGASLYLYTRKEASAYGVRTAYVTAGAGAKGALFRNFAFDKDETGFYSFSDGETTVFRTKFHTSPAETGFVESALTVSESLSLVELCCADIAAMRCATLEELRNALKPYAENVTLLVSLRGEEYDGVVFTNDVASVSFDSAAGILPAELFE